MITEDYVSFEVAKLLKEKGFDESCKAFITPNVNFALEEDRVFNHLLSDYEYAAPTHQMAMKWLRKKHHIHANPIQQGNYNDYFEYYSWIVAKDGVIYRNQSVSEKLSYEDAVEAAIKYCLTNLIK